MKQKVALSWIKNLTFLSTKVISGGKSIVFFDFKLFFLEDVFRKQKVTFFEKELSVELISGNKKLQVFRIFFRGIQFLKTFF